MKILVTGFTRSAGKTINPLLGGRPRSDDLIAGTDIIKREIPTRIPEASIDSAQAASPYIS